MKKILILLLLFVATFVNAQCYTKFKGIEIKGNIDAFGAQLEKQEFKLLEKGATSYGYQGKLSGEDVALIVYFSLKSHTVSAVTVFFDDKGIRSLMERRYDYLQELLTQKYGEPAEKDVHTDNQTIYNYCTRWKDECGGVSLKMIKTPVSKYNDVENVIITYWSKEGDDLSKTELSEDL